MVDPYLCTIVKNPLLFRFTIGPTSDLGLLCLEQSIAQIQKLYDPEIVVCHNCDLERVAHLPVRLIDQRSIPVRGPQPIGVAWKLHPARLDIDRHEIAIDNDLLLHDHIPQIDHFIKGKHALMLEEETRTYGRFTRHVPAHLHINSGLYGMPPGFDFASYVEAHAGEMWEENAVGEYAASRTFDEQGLVALILSHQKYDLIPKTVITNCERRWMKALGNHFIGLNRTESHQPFLNYLMHQLKLL